MRIKGWDAYQLQEDDGSWTIKSLALPGLVVCGATADEAWAAWPAAVESWAMAANNWRVKAERDVEEARGVACRLEEQLARAITPADLMP